jgi:Flp pilus assembly protein TadD
MEPIRRGPSRSSVEQPEGSTVQRENEAAASLLEKAARLEHAGESERAATVLERALRVAPEDPRIWQRLAALRLHQGQADQAENLAKKSNLLAGEDPGLQARNWRIIADARRAVGDGVGARIADQRAEELASGR